MSEQLDEIRLEEEPREETPQVSEPQPEVAVAELEPVAAPAAEAAAASKAAPDVEAVAGGAADATEAAAPEAAPETATAASSEDVAAETASAVEASAPDTESAVQAVVEAAAPEASVPDAEAESTEEPAAEATTAPAAEATTAPAAEASPESTDERQQRHLEVMASLTKSLEEKEPIKGKVIGWNKGGFHVAIESVAAFCPVSQIEVGNPKSPKRYMDRTFRFRIIEIEEGGRRVVLSRAAALKTEREARAAKVRETLSPGLELEGRVSSLTSFGAFVDLGGGIEGLVHVSEISRRRVEHPKEALRTGQQVKVCVLKIENNGERISLSMKKLERDPWDGAAERYPTGGTFEGKIVRKAEFGLFVEVEPGLEGLVHTSRLPLGTTLEDESLEVGSTIQGWVHQVEGRRRRMALSLREVSNNDPWKNVEERFPVGGVYPGHVERVADFGAFIELEPGLTGLLPFSAVQQTPNANLRRQYHPGKKVSIRILSVDKGKRRISLGTESSKAVGTQADYKEYIQKQNRGEGLNAMAAAFARARSSD